MFPLIDLPSFEQIVQFRESPAPAVESQKAQAPAFGQPLGRHDPVEAPQGRRGSGPPHPKEPQEGQADFGARGVQEVQRGVRQSGRVRDPVEVLVQKGVSPDLPGLRSAVGFGSKIH